MLCVRVEARLVKRDRHLQWPGLTLLRECRCPVANTFKIVSALNPTSNMSSHPSSHEDTCRLRKHGSNLVCRTPQPQRLIIRVGPRETMTVASQGTSTSRRTDVGLPLAGSFLFKLLSASKNIGPQDAIEKKNHIYAKVHARC